MFRRDRGSDRDRFEQFTERARKVLSLAQEEAQRFNHNFIGTEHLLLGLVREGDGIAAKVLSNLGIELNRVRGAVEFIIGRGSGRDDRAVLGEVGLTPRAKRVMELAVDEARRLDHHYVGTEHLLLGLIREGVGIAAGVLRSLGLTLEQVREETLRVLALAGQRRDVLAEAMPPPQQQAGLKSNVVTCRLDDRALEGIDALVEAGVRATRSEAAAWLIAAGIEANRELFTRVNATIEQIRRLRAEAQAIAQQVVSAGARAPEAAGEQPTPPEAQAEQPDGPDERDADGDEGASKDERGE